VWVFIHPNHPVSNLVYEYIISHPKFEVSVLISRKTCRRLVLNIIVELHVYIVLDVSYVTEPVRSRLKRHHEGSTSIIRQSAVITTKNIEGV